jgi:hypothetical protein
MIPDLYTNRVRRSGSRRALAAAGLPFMVDGLCGRQKK